MDQLAEIHRHRWKEHLKISKNAKFEEKKKFESDRIKNNNGGGHVCAQGVTADLDPRLVDKPPSWIWTP